MLFLRNYPVNIGYDTVGRIGVSLARFRFAVALQQFTPLTFTYKNHYRKVRHYMFGYLQGIAAGPELE